jgi:hypothetical protein
MIAEVKLYWILYQNLYDSQVDLSELKHALQGWQQDWAALFSKKVQNATCKDGDIDIDIFCVDQPRSQFLQMGLHFGYLLAYSQSLKSAQRVVSGSVLADMIRLSTTIINLAMDTTDERTRHLTDHIYHIIVFSALTLCRLVHTYEPKLRAANQDIVSLDSLVVSLIDWLKSIGPPCHAAHMLGGIVSAQFKKLRPGFGIIDNQSLPTDVAFLYPNFVGSELFDMSLDLTQWPEWDQMFSDTDISV